MMKPPKYFTKEREAWDLEMLRIFYLIVEEAGYDKYSPIQELFSHLLKFIGTPEFSKKSIFLASFVENIIHPERKHTIEPGDDEYIFGL